MAQVLRRSIRLKAYDYTQDGAYFVTLLAHRRAHLFGEVMDGEMGLNTLGCVADACWWAIAEHFPGVELDTFVVMPNHVHRIIVINRWAANTISGDSQVRARHVVPLQPQTESFGKPVVGSLPTIIRSYKAAVTRQINHIRQTPGTPVWQRNYYEHIIRSDRSLQTIREYILYNPARWADDEYFG